jgi:hypothetical protein
MGRVENATASYIRRISNLVLMCGIEQFAQPGTALAIEIVRCEEKETLASFRVLLASRGRGVSYGAPDRPLR